MGLSLNVGKLRQQTTLGRTTGQKSGVVGCSMYILHMVDKLSSKKSSFLLEFGNRGNLTEVVPVLRTPLEI